MVFCCFFFFFCCFGEDSALRQFAADGADRAHVAGVSAHRRQGAGAVPLHQTPRVHQGQPATRLPRGTHKGRARVLKKNRLLVEAVLYCRLGGL